MRDINDNRIKKTNHARLGKQHKNSSIFLSKIEILYIYFGKKSLVERKELGEEGPTKE
jgi:hypothetical protein